MTTNLHPFIFFLGFDAPLYYCPSPAHTEKRVSHSHTQKRERESGERGRREIGQLSQAVNQISRTEEDPHLLLVHASPPHDFWACRHTTTFVNKARIVFG